MQKNNGHHAQCGAVMKVATKAANVIRNISMERLVGQLELHCA
jgi:hypothetical protein